jgi:hypothetical protein
VAAAMSGMGHVALTTTKPAQLRGYYNTVFDARLSDCIDETINGMKLKIRFLRVNERHHTVLCRHRHAHLRRPCWWWMFRPGDLGADLAQSESEPVTAAGVSARCVGGADTANSAR